MVDAIQPGSSAGQRDDLNHHVVLGRGFDLRRKGDRSELEDADDRRAVTLGHDRRLAAAAAVAGGGVEHKLLAMLELLEMVSSFR